MISHEDLSEYLRNAGYTTGARRESRQIPGEEKIHLAQHDDLGVALKWQTRGDDIRISFRMRTGAGGNYGPYSPWSILKDLSVLDGYRGAPSERKQLSEPE